MRVSQRILKTGDLTRKRPGPVCKITGLGLFPLCSCIIFPFAVLFTCHIEDVRPRIAPRVVLREYRDDDAVVYASLCVKIVSSHVRYSV